MKASSRKTLRKKLLVSALAAPLAIAGCGTVEIQSEPRDADVFAVTQGQDKGKPLGKTPYKATLSELSKLAGSGPILLQIRKNGFQSQSVVVPDIPGGQLKISTDLKSSTSESFRDINRAVRLALRAEREILEKRFDAALATAQEIRKINESAVISHEIEGAVLMLQGELTKSRESWERSLAIDPDNSDARAMLQLIKEKSGRSDTP